MFKKISLLVAAAAVLAGCATQSFDERAKVIVDGTTTRGKEVTQKIEGRATPLPIYEKVPGLWISDRVVTKASGQRLPPVFDRPFALREQQPLTLADIADAIRASTGLTVAIQGDSLGLVPERLAVDHSGSLRSLLDTTAARLGVLWSWEDGRLLVTQSVIKTIPIRRSGIEQVTAVFSAPTGSSSGGGGARGGAGGGSAQGRDPWTELDAAIKAIAPNVRVTLMRSSSTIVVAGAPAQVKRVEDLLSLDDKGANKQVVLRWQLVSFSASNGAKEGIDLNYILQRGSGAFSLASPTSLLDGSNGVLQLNKTAGNSSGTAAALGLLNTMGRAHVLRSGLATMKSNERADINNEKDIYYLAKSTPGVASASTGGNAGVGLETASVTVGVAGAFGAAIYDDESMDLSYDFSLSTLDALKNISSAGQVIQAPEVSRTSAKGRLLAKHGDTFVLSMQDSDSSSFDHRGLLPSGPAGVIGGSQTGARDRTQWLLLVQPVITNRTGV